MRDFFFALAIIFAVPFYVFANSDECNTSRVETIIMGELSRPATGVPMLKIKKEFSNGKTLACRVDGSYPMKNIPLHGVVYLQEGSYPAWSWDKE